MKILKVETARVQIELLMGNNIHNNRIDLLTGENGSGKTEILTALADTFRVRRKASTLRSVEWMQDGRRFINWEPNSAVGPTRIITQTFSPFTRFPAPNESEIPLTSIYTDGQEGNSHYMCIGLHKSSRLVGLGISKRTLEQAIYRLSEKSTIASTVFEVMRNLKFEDNFNLTYQVRPSLTNLLHSVDNGGLYEYLRSFSDSSKFSYGALRKELRLSDLNQVVELLGEAIRVIGPRIEEGPLFHHEFGFKRTSSYDFATLQALSLLRRFELLALRKFEVTTQNGRTFDVANASSGQQQILCSIIGLATALDHNSLVLIDEPELSLHPRWQQTYLDSLNAVLERFHGCHILIATHSPLIVQRGDELGTGIVYVGKDHHVEFHASKSQSVEGTLLEVFTTPVTGSVHIANQILSAVTSAESGEQQARQNSLDDLQQLQAIYTAPQANDTKTLALIRDAIDLVETSDKGEGAGQDKDVSND
jgi:predicted ATPase